MSALALALGDAENSAAFAARATTYEPALELGWWSLLRAQSSAEDFADATETLAHLEDHAEEVIRSMAPCGQATLVSDESISCGGCIIETQHGVINAEIENQLERIASELLE